MYNQQLLWLLSLRFFVSGRFSVIIVKFYCKLLNKKLFVKILFKSLHFEAWLMEQVVPNTNILYLAALPVSSVPKKTAQKAQWKTELYNNLFN